MAQIKEIKDISPKKGFFYYLKIFFYKLGVFSELFLIFAVWWFIFHKNFEFKNISREELITYLIVANFIGMISSYFFGKIAVLGISSETSKTLIYSPMLFFKRLMLKTLGINFFPFLAMIFFQSMLFYFFHHYFVVNFDKKYLLTIFLMLFLSFIIELLYMYILRMLVFWFFELKARYNLIVRLKKILAGNYFPIDILPVIFVKISLILPFSYAFFVPYELYLKKISLEKAYYGIVIEIFWIFFFYFLIRVINFYQVKRASLNP